MSIAIVVGLGFGDEGKGKTVATLTQQMKATWNVRFNGGAQAGHNVWLRNESCGDIHHCFSQFGSGTFFGAQTYLSRFIAFDPVAAIHEAKALADKIDCSIKNLLPRLWVDPNCSIVTPFHVASSRVRQQIEAKTTNNQFMSCGRGIGELRLFEQHYPEFKLTPVLFLGKDAQWIGQQLTEHQELIRFYWEHNATDLRLHNKNGQLLLDSTEPQKIADALCEIMEHMQIADEGKLAWVLNRETVVFEGAQGVLLDEWHGFHPYTTWSTTTQKNALTLLQENNCKIQPKVYGVTRAYHTRHGDGPFPTQQSGFLKIFDNNEYNQYQGHIKNGWLDFVLLRYAIECMAHYSPIYGLSVTHLDHPCLEPIKHDLYKWLLVSMSHKHQTDGFFDYLKPCFTQDLDYQETLTKRLQGCIYTEKLPDTTAISFSGDLLNLLTDETGIPVKLTSFTKYC